MRGNKKGSIKNPDFQRRNTGIIGQETLGKSHDKLMWDWPQVSWLEEQIDARMVKIKPPKIYDSPLNVDETKTDLSHLGRPHQEEHYKVPRKLCLVDKETPKEAVNIGSHAPIKRPLPNKWLSTITLLILFDPFLGNLN